MVLTKYRLPNDNVFIWLGRGGIWEKSEGEDNVLILAGGDALFLKTFRTIELQNDEVKRDIENMSYEEFVKKYGLPTNGDLWKDLKEGIKSREYPPFLEHYEERIAGYKGMISLYIWRILHLKDPNEKIKHLEDVIGECRRHIASIRAKLSRRGLR
jgi:hypothetical protein